MILKRTEYIKNFVIDSKREIFQLFILFICLITPFLFDFKTIIKIILGESSVNIDNAKYYGLMILGNWFMGVLFTLFVLFRFVRSSNKETIFNRGNIYHDKPYWWYWICSKVLGYEKCNLILVPIYTQYKLVLRDTFRYYPFDDNDFPEQKCNVVVDKNLKDDHKQQNEFNLIIQDTYPILEEQIPYDMQTNDTIFIKREYNSFGERVYSRNLVNKVVEEIRVLDDNLILNIFSTTNPKNTYEIAKKAISLAQRGNIKHVYVFQQNRDGNRSFDTKPHRIM